MITTPNGLQMQVAVPAGVLPGSSMMVNVPATPAAPVQPTVQAVAQPMTTMPATTIAQPIAVVAVATNTTTPVVAQQPAIAVAVAEPAPAPAITAPVTVQPAVAVAAAMATPAAPVA